LSDFTWLIFVPFNGAHGFGGGPLGKALLQVGEFSLGIPASWPSRLCDTSLSLSCRIIVLLDVFLKGFISFLVYKLLPGEKIVSDLVRGRQIWVLDPGMRDNFGQGQAHARMKLEKKG
jgi:hypothetical protein